MLICVGVGDVDGGVDAVVVDDDVGVGVGGVGVDGGVVVAAAVVVVVAVVDDDDIDGDGGNQALGFWIWIYNSEDLQLKDVNVGNDSSMMELLVMWRAEMRSIQGAWMISLFVGVDSGNPALGF